MIKRELEFRAWDKRSKVMTTHFALIHGKPMRKNYDGIYFIEIELIPMQYTGLKDDNDKKIFEGDIVETLIFGEGTFFCEVIYSDGCFKFKPIKEEKELTIVGNMVDNSYLTKCKIIGNIFKDAEC